MKNWRLSSLIFSLSLLVCCDTYAQILDESFLSAFEYRNIGPSNQGGRISDIEADPNDFTKIYFAAASGGVWKSNNAGTTWEPIFDDYETASIGDIALDPKNSEVIWVGTGEANNRNSVSWGNGIYKSEDGGKTFQKKGLESTHQIARVLVNPEDSDEICVCAIGHLWGYSGERGLFKSKDGGNTWSKLNNGLPDDGKTGCTDIVRDSKDPNILYAAFYHRLRQPWHFHSGGEQGGIYKSTDGGATWKKLSKGLPQGPTGRIGLAIYEKDPNILMAIVEAEKTDTLAVAGSGVYRSEDGGENWKYVNLYNNRPFYYSQIRINPHDDQRVYVLTTRFMVSEDGGNTFVNGSLDQEVHGDFHALWHDPINKDRYYLGADKGLSLTHDHGKTFQLFDNLPIAQFYRINYDHRDPYYVYGGLQDNGSYATASFSRDARGVLNDSNWKMHWGDGQDSASNPDDWTDMYSSMENGSYFKYNPQTRQISRISPSVFTTTNYHDHIDKDEKDKDSAVRFNWSAPLVMSTHNYDHIYIGGNHVYKSTNKGKDWKIISPDLSTNDKVKRVHGNSGGVTPDNTGAETHCSITGISLSEKDKNIIWVCTDDGNVQVTKNDGKKWKNVRKKISDVPEGLWASRILASHHETSRAYVSFDGHRSDHFESYIYRTDDFGKSWKRITNGFTKGEVVRVIVEDRKNPNLLFAGTETGVWYTSNGGDNWARLKLNMPTVSVYDIKIHPRENALLIGTHGRSLWVLDDISPLQEWNNEIADAKMHIFSSQESTLWQNVSRGGQRGHFWFAGDNPKAVRNTSSLPRAGFKNDAVITYKVGEGIADSLTLAIENKEGTLTQLIKVAPTPGIHRYYWNRHFSAPNFTVEEREELDKILQSVVAEIGNSRVRRMYAKFKETSSSDEIREMLEPFTGGYLNFTFDPKFLIPKAEAGTYKLMLIGDGQTVEGELVIREDPLLKN